MVNIHFRKAVAATAFVLCATFTGIGQATPPPPPPAAGAPKPPAKIENFEEAQQALQRAQAELARTLKDLKLSVPTLPDEHKLEAMIGEIKQAAEMQAAAALSEKKMEAVKKEMAVALIQAQEALVHLKNNKELQVQQAELQQKVQQHMKEAQVQMAAAAEEMKQFEHFVNSLAADGLIQKDAYHIEEKNGALIIDGKEQPAAVYEKHRTFLNKHKGLKITRDQAGLQVEKD
jgi:hypothetical protein